MSAQRSRDAAPELAVRRLLHARGLRYRVDHPLPGLPRRRGDLVFTAARVVVLINGCYWHGCHEHGNIPRTNTDYWAPKIARNRARDADTRRQLTEAGWQVVQVWEHEDPHEVADQIQLAVARRCPNYRSASD